MSLCKEVEEIGTLYVGHGEDILESENDEETLNSEVNEKTIGEEDDGMVMELETGNLTAHFITGSWGFPGMWNS
ncbi:hypothetical protein AMTR_s00041p00226590 [Amborella trichopoda]|uniref:Uncharacterized protein n=1 Tax=Amborella trichopoda TaxID=13333 RepID=W1PZE2_AMBTC|nr:hypothetical protein AMTR_s00041p00226590 [Amborella trichopoda]